MAGGALLALLCCALTSHLVPVIALENGLARTPPMGYNTWNRFGCNIDEQLIKETADALVALGLRDAGYNYLNIDDCWSLHARTKEGALQPDPVRFPSGMAALSDYVHSKGLQFGMYTDAGLFTCAGYPGSRGHEHTDAKTFASWGVDYLKVDNCFAASEDVVERYTAMRDALNATGRPIVYSVCDWGVADPWLWGPQIGNSWRTDGDISPTWDSIMRCLDGGAAGLARFASPGAWNDPDMLELGNNNLPLTMQRAHFALWALVKAPLLIGTDLRRVSPATLNILKAKEVIAINQDPLGVAGDLLWKQGPREVWGAPLANGERAVVLFSRHTSGPPAELTVTWQQIGLPKDAQARVRDLYAQKDLGTFSESFTTRINNADVAVLRVQPLNPESDYDAWRPWHGEEPAALQAAARAAGRAARLETARSRGNRRHAWHGGASMEVQVEQ